MIPQLHHCLQAPHPFTPYNIHFHKHLGTQIPYSPKSSMTWVSFQITNKPCSCEVLRYLNPNVSSASPLNAFYKFSERPYAWVNVFALADMAQRCICQTLCVSGQQNRPLVGPHCLEMSCSVRQCSPSQ